MEAILDKAHQISPRDAEVFGVTQTDTSMSFEANRLKMVDTRETSGLALRLVKDGRIGFSSTTNLAEEDALVERALEMAPFGAEALLELPSAVGYPVRRSTTTPGWRPLAWTLCGTWGRASSTR